MNKLLIFVLVTFCVFSSFAQANDSKNGAFGMSAGEKLLVYETSKQDPIVPFLLNLFLGFGIGSFAQGDILGGSLILGFDAVGIGLILTGLIWISKRLMVLLKKLLFNGLGVRELC
ncbi:outer membrane protein P13 [Borreliella burgdorferi WI91-23]|nr:outer membrane protein P13 [Borreliella burgdorferi WI91-23]